MNPFFNFHDAPDDLSQSWISAIKNVLSSGNFINGLEKEQFEKEFARYLGTAEAVGVSNGLDGLILALEACGIGAGMAVAVPNHTFIATWLAVHHVGASPVGIKVDSKGLMDLEDLSQKLSCIDAVIPVHMHGLAVDMFALMSLVKNRDIIVIEDASQSHGASLSGHKLGSFGDVGVFSLYPTKNLGALGDAGIIVTDSPSIANTLKSIANYGSKSDNKYQHIKIGRNSRLDEIQAAILRVNLTLLDQWNAHRIEIACLYQQIFDTKGISSLASADSIYHHYIIFAEKNRDDLRRMLTKMQIPTEIYYPFPAYREYSLLKKQELPELDTNAEYIANHSLALPISQWLSTTQAKAIAASVVEHFS